MEEEEDKGKVCVTGGTGYVASWLIMRLLQHGYSVNTTIRPATTKNNTSFLTNLPGASSKLRLFPADLDDPDSFVPAIRGCVGVFHVAHPIDFLDSETEETITNRSLRSTLAILRASLDSKTVRRVVYTSSASALTFRERAGGEDPPPLDEESWSDVDFIRSSRMLGASYFVSKTITERAALDFGQRHSFDVVSVVPNWIHGPFVCPGLPGSVRASLALCMGNEQLYKYYEKTPFVHVDDVASAHIFVFEKPEAKGRYICSSVEIEFDELCEFVSKRYPEFQMTSQLESLVNRSVKGDSFSSKKLLDAGFRYQYGIEEMFDGAIECCKQKGLL